MVRTLFVLVALCGMVVSGLALRAHYATDTQPCDINERWDCGIVNHSRFAVVHGLPVAVLGLIGYGSLAALAWSRFSRVRLLGAGAGFLYALSLTRIEAQVLHVWCLYCVISQGIITILLLVAGILYWQQRGRPARLRT